MDQLRTLEDAAQQDLRQQHAAAAVGMGSAEVTDFARQLPGRLIERLVIERLEVAAPQFRIRVFAGNDFTLLGDPKATGHAAGRLRQDRLV